MTIPKIIKYISDASTKCLVANKLNHVAKIAAGEIVLSLSEDFE